jgi:hypothetical protein
MKIRRSNFLLAICVALTGLTLSCVGFVWTQNNILRTATSAVAMPARILDRESAYIARVESVTQLRALAASRLRSQESALNLVNVITRNIKSGLVTLLVLLVLLFTGTGLLVRQLRLETSAR